MVESVASESEGAGVVSLAARRARTAPTPDYAALLAEVARGNPAAEAALMRALTAPLEVVLRNRLRGAPVDDLRQETLLVVLQAARAGQIQEPRALVDFALTTARQLMLNEDRKRQRQRTDSRGEMDDLPDAQPDGFDFVVGEQRRHCVEKVIAGIGNERERQLLHAYYLEEQPSDQLQARFGLDSGQLGRVLYRARQHFAALWNALAFETI